MRVMLGPSRFPHKIIATRGILHAPGLLVRPMLFPAKNVENSIFRRVDINELCFPAKNAMGKETAFFTK